MNGNGKNNLHSAETLGFVLSEGDLSILEAVHEFRFLRREHLSMLLGRHPKRLHRRLLKLIRKRYLIAIRLPQQKHIYSIGKAGLLVLASLGIATANDRLRTSELKELFLKHEMMIVDHHVILRLAGQSGDLHLVRWEEGRALFDSVLAADRGGFTKLPVRPDAFFTIEDRRRETGNNQFHFFLEIDRSTMPHTIFKQKLTAYRHYREQGIHAKKYRIRSFRVLTMTLTDARAQNLCDLAASMLPEGTRKHFLFGDANRCSLQDPKAVFEEIFLSARAGLVPLVPEPESSLTKTA